MTTKNFLVTAIKKLDANIADLMTEVSRARAKKQELTSQLQLICDHTDTEESEVYHEGTYYDKASTVTTTSCATCGMVLSTNRITHTWYG